jgi:hypothetical protein
MRRLSGRASTRCSACLGDCPKICASQSLAQERVFACQRRGGQIGSRTPSTPSQRPVSLNKTPLIRALFASFQERYATAGLRGGGGSRYRTCLCIADSLLTGKSTGNSSNSAQRRRPPRSQSVCMFSDMERTDFAAEQGILNHLTGNLAHKAGKDIHGSVSNRFVYISRAPRIVDRHETLEFGADRALTHLAFLNLTIKK